MPGGVYDCHPIAVCDGYVLPICVGGQQALPDGCLWCDNGAVDRVVYRVVRERGTMPRGFHGSGTNSVPTIIFLSSGSTSSACLRDWMLLRS